MAALPERSELATRIPPLAQRPEHPLSGFIDELFVRHWKDLCQYLRVRYGEDGCDPEEVAQAAFVKLVELPAPDKLDNPKAFLFAAARNVAIDEFRKRRTRLAHGQACEQSEREEATSFPCAERIVLGEERLRRLSAAIRALPRVQRTVLLLHRLDGWAYSRIARKLDTSETTVRRHMEQALAAIHRRMLDAGDAKR